jgi:S-disulfanyl-L-cysteine oxidoreductase SoxD
LRKTVKNIFVLVVVAFSIAEARAVQNGLAGKTVRDGVYTEAQALRGEEAFVAECMECHDGQADGPLLNSDDFTNRWREDSLSHVFSYMRTKMPESDPGSLSESTYLDLLSYVLWLNKFPAGAADLKVDALPNIQFQGMDGPKPLPVGTLVQSAGCLNQAGNQQWELGEATPPSRTRNMVETEEAFKALETRPLGTSRVRLEGVTALRPGFDAAMYQGYKVWVKGFFTYQNAAAGIEVMTVRPLTSTCKS